MDRRRFLRRAGGLGAVGFAGCTGLLVTDDDEFDVGMSANAFQPRELAIDIGETVVWLNNGSRAHTVTAYINHIPDDAAYFATGGYEDEATAWDAWHSYEGGNLYSGERFEHTFEVAGVHEYYCIPHEQGGMRGSIVVED